MISAEKGARTVIYLASSPEVAGASGGDYVNCKPAHSSSIARDEATARRLWEVSERLTGLPSQSLISPRYIGPRRWRVRLALA